MTGLESRPLAPSLTLYDYQTQRTFIKPLTRRFQVRDLILSSQEFSKAETKMGVLQMRM